MNNTTKLMGAWGGVVALAMGLLGNFVTAAGLVGAVANLVVLVALFRAASQLRLPLMRNSIIVSLVVGALAGIAFFVLAGTALVTVLSDPTAKISPDLYPQLGAGGLAAWMLFCGSAWYWFRAMQELARGSGVPLFATVGRAYFAGALLLIVGIGLFALLAAQVMQIVAFFRVQEGGGVRPPPMPPPEPEPRSGWGPKG